LSREIDSVGSVGRSRDNDLDGGVPGNGAGPFGIENCFRAVTLKNPWICVYQHDCRVVGGQSKRTTKRLNVRNADVGAGDDAMLWPVPLMPAE
jgi:hypothetical protein